MFLFFLEDIDPCLVNNTCLNNGTCTREGRNAKCKCVQGFVGAYCEKDLDECNLKPCVNGGECINTGMTNRSKKKKLIFLN